MKRRATTIIELAAVIVILALGMPALMNAFREAAHTSSDAGNATIASFLCVERMEQIIARRYRSYLGYGDIASANFPDTDEAVSGFSGFTRTVTISDVTIAMAASGSNVGYKKVRVEVAWNSGAQKLGIERVFANF